MTEREIKMYDTVIELRIATERELSLARQLVDGSWTEIIEAVIFARSGYRTLEQFIECDGEVW